MADTRDPWVLEPKHKVFLSHSGAQKGFVEQLCVDLERCDRYPFFDKRRDSLPIGEPFPPLIFQAIQQCQVGVVILSEEFFSSKWPMLELVEMVLLNMKDVPHMIKIMPIFLSISCADLDNEVKQCQWISKWHVWAKSDERVDVEEWKRALKLLKSKNGLVYNHGLGVVKFREEIVKEINKIVPPLSKWNDSHIHGKLRLCQAIYKKIMSTPMSQTYKVRVMGLYGVGGIGKTTACKSLCNDLFKRFEGRVCHIEFVNGKSEVDRLREILKKLTDSKHDLLKEWNIDECQERLRNVMQLQKVFLEIDNLSNTSEMMEEVERYLQVGYDDGSIVMVTARSKGLLKNLRIDDSDCLAMPELEEDEARALFLYHATPKIEVDLGIIEHCIKRCYFAKGDSSYHYHPLALKVLGSQLKTKDLKEWGLCLNDVDTFNQFREKENPIFYILRSSFDDLLLEDQLLFMDVVVFNNNDGILYLNQINIFEQLRVVYELSVDVIKDRLKALERKSLLEKVEDGTTGIGIHDLWREFAVMETRVGEIESRRWVYELVEGPAQESCLSTGGWKNLLRICLKSKSYIRRDVRVTCLNFTDCTRVTVLKLVGVVVENNALDLSALKQLKSLEIIPDGQSPTVSGIGLLTKLAILVWLRISVDSFSAIEEISCLANLQFLQLSSLSDEGVSLKFDLGRLWSLRAARISGFKGEVTISGLSSKMTNLRILDLRNCYVLRSCPGVGDIMGLEELDFRWCKKLEELPNLQKLTKLRRLQIGGCKSLAKLTGLGSLVALEELQAWKCKNLIELPDMSKLTNLQVLNLERCDSLKNIPGLQNLIALQEFVASVQLLKGSHDLKKLLKTHKVKMIVNWDHKHYPQDLQRTVMNLANLDSTFKLCVSNMPNEELITNLSKLKGLQKLTIQKCGFKTLSGLSDLSALKSLELDECSVERLPDMGKHMKLESLAIWNCASLEGWDGVGRLTSSESQTGVDLHCDWTLPHLEKMRWFNAPVIELPDMSRFPCLKSLLLSRCDNLTSLTSSGPMTALEVLDLGSCKSLKGLPNVRLFPRLRDLYISESGVTLNEEEVESLRARCPSLYVNESRWKFKPGPSRIEIIPDNEPSWDSGLHALDAPTNLLEAGPSSTEDHPPGSEFIPYSEPNCELGLLAPPESNDQITNFWKALTDRIMKFFLCCR